MSAARRGKLEIVNHLLNSAATSSWKGIARDVYGYPITNTFGGQWAAFLEAEREAIVAMGHRINGIVRGAAATGDKEARRRAFADLCELRDALLELEQLPEHVDDWERYLEQHHRKGDAA